jgi:hypothetical protein
VVERKRLSRGRGGKEKVRLPGKVDCGEEIDANRNCGFSAFATVI